MKRDFPKTDDVSPDARTVPVTNYLVTGAGIIGLLLFSIVEYHSLPSLWSLFLMFRLGLAVCGAGLLIIPLITGKGARICFYAFWVPFFLLASIAAGRLPLEPAVAIWNVYLCTVVLLVAVAAVLQPRIAWILPVVALASYLISFLVSPAVSFGRMLVNGGIPYLISLLIMYPLMNVKYRLTARGPGRQKSVDRSCEELAALNEAKDRFFSIIAHDLKGPIGSSARVLDRMVKDDQVNAKDDIALLDETVNRAYSLLENLLLWARCQRGELNVIPVEINVHRLFEQVWRDFAEEAEKKKLTLEDGIEREHTVVADKKTLVIIVRNLVSNAVRFSTGGGTVRVSTEKRGERLVFEVRDSGVGMDAETVGQLFRIDRKRETMTPDGVKGTGMGLIVSKELAEKNGGAIGVVSVPGEGSAFFLELPSA